MPVIAIVCIIAIRFLGTSASDKFSEVGSLVDNSTILFPLPWR